ncbi:MAG: metal-dependent transcriptional regulator, partial [Verrucomicrobiales bacterium]|nr:metal-dependent transcriptional regulator [Verrucomicrobiales bacterium]
MPTSTVENYLKAILHLQGEGKGSTTVGEIARVLAVTPGTVTIMMRQLKERGLVAYEPRRGLSLRPRGRTAALKVVRRHRLIELFLVEVMKLDWSEVHEEAEILEHVISDRLLDRIDIMLGEPTHDPHGDPI